MASFNNYIRQRINKMLDDIQPARARDWLLNKISVGIEFSVIEYDENGNALVRTGTRDRPDGISLLGDVFIMFVDKQRSYNYFYIHVLDLKNYIKDNIDRLEKRMDDKYTTLGYVINLRELKEFLNRKDAYYGAI